MRSSKSTVCVSHEADGWNDHRATGKDMLLHLPKHPTEHLMQSNDLFFPVVLFGQQPFDGLLMCSGKPKVQDALIAQRVGKRKSIQSRRVPMSLAFFFLMLLDSVRHIPSVPGLIPTVS